jgi:squalene-hopene/tetraprenyl-beta-curcumene cyclase
LRPESQTATLVERPPADLEKGVTSALDRAVNALLARQNSVGWWVGEDEANCTLDSEYIFFLHYTGLIGRPHYQEKMRRLANRIRGQQRADGTWAIHYDGPGEISCTTESYFALKLAGDSADAPHMQRAREWIRKQGGPLKARVLTRIQLALMGQMDWRACPALPIQLMFAPKASRFNIYEISYWARACTVPLAILCDHRRSLTLPKEKGIQELFPADSVPVDLAARERADVFSWKNFFIQGDRFLKWADKKNLSPFRRTALRRAERWIRKHQDPSGDWGGIFPAIVNSLMALHVRGMSVEDDVFKRGLQALERFEIHDSSHSAGVSAKGDPKDEVHIQPCVSPVWDTAWSVLALSEARVPHEHDAIRRATDWLAKMQIRRRGDWRVKCPGLKPGGWAFQFYNDRYPDTDDSSVVLMGLLNGPDTSHERREVFKRGVRWVLGLQNADGGWGAFERDVDDDIYNEILYNDEKNMLDPSTADVTGRVLECLGYCGIGPDDPVVARAIAFLRRDQGIGGEGGLFGTLSPEGSWWGRWGVNYVYGTWSVLRGLAAIGLPLTDPMIVRAADFIEKRQNADGGWGESCITYRPGMANDVFRSTASQTAWGVLGLIAAGRSQSEQVRRGVEWLLAHQRGAHEALNGDLWFEREFTGTGFPNAFYLRYHYYAIYFPILALAAYRNALAKG